MYYLLYKINIVKLQCSLFEELRHHIHKIKTLNKIILIHQLTQILYEFN